MVSQKVRYILKLSFLRRQESSLFKLLWIPAFAGMTRFLTFYDSINLKYSIFNLTDRGDLPTLEKGRKIFLYVLAALFLGLCGYGFFVEPDLIEVNHVRIEAPGLNEMGAALLRRP
jgi:hypothetical protein